MRYTNKQILKITYPVLISLLMEHMIGLTDTAYLGRVGEVELGASALAGVYYLVIYMLGFGFSVGAQVLMARRNGEGEYKRIGEVFTQGGLFLFLLAAVLFTASNLLTPHLLHRMIGSEEVYRATMSCAVGEPYCYAETTLTTICAGEEFTAKGKVVLSEGWKAVERKMLGELLGKQKEPAVLPDVQEQSRCSVSGAELKEGQTSPPKHFTEDLLLHAMETASADSMPEGVERQGIGTPATRAATIEKLVQKGFLERKGTKKTKVLLPTDKGKALITVMPEEIQSPEMTADWETKLLQIERGEMEPSEFMTEINTMITELVKNTEMKKGANALMKNKIIGICPNCDANVVEREKGWFCENRECRFVLWKDNAFFKRLGKHLDAHVADKLLRDGRVRLKDCKSAKGKTYNATVLLSCEADGRSKFSLEFEGGC